jgi:1,4-dihydroxy-6-naphthoate synthase
VNSFSADVEEEGERAVQELYRRAVAAGAVEESGLPLFVEPV